jgi:hypothetical protein
LKITVIAVSKNTVIAGLEITVIAGLDPAISCRERSPGQARG